MKETIIRHSYSNISIKMPTAETISAMKVLSYNSFSLLVYYYSKYSGWNFADEHILNELNIPSKRMLSKYKNELIVEGYLHIDSSVSFDIYTIGKTEVKKLKDKLNG